MQHWTAWPLAPSHILKDADIGARNKGTAGAGNYHRAGRRQNMRGISGKEKTPVLHRLRYEAAHGRHPFLKDGALIQAEIVSGFETPLQLLPNPVIGPPRQIFARLALQIGTGDLRTAHTKQ